MALPRVWVEFTELSVSVVPESDQVLLVLDLGSSYTTMHQLDTKMKNENTKKQKLEVAKELNKRFSTTKPNSLSREITHWLKGGEWTNLTLH